MYVYVCRVLLFSKVFCFFVFFSPSVLSCWLIVWGYFVVVVGGVVSLLVVCLFMLVMLLIISMFLCSFLVPLVFCIVG